MLLRAHQKRLPQFTGVFLAILAAVMCWVESGLFSNSFFEAQSFGIWFNADVPRIVDTLNYRDAEGHGIAFKHPIFSIIFWPITQIFKLFSPNVIEAIRLLLAANAAFSTFLLWSLLRKSSMPITDAMLCSLLFITSSGFIFWLTVPETYAFATTSILLSLHVLFLKKAQNHLALLREALLCAASLTITITNWSVGILAIFLRYGLIEWPLTKSLEWLRKPWADRWQKVKLPLLILSLAFFIVLVLAFIQNVLFDYASLFVNVKFLLSESRFVPGRSILELPSRIFDLIVGPIVAGQVYVTNPQAGDGAIRYIEMSNTANLNYLAWFATAGWICVLAMSFFSIWSAKEKDELMLTIVLSLFGFLILHFFYGGIYFLYSGNFLPILIILASFGLRGRFRNLSRVLFLVVICGGFFNSLESFQEAISIISS